MKLDITFDLSTRFEQTIDRFLFARAVRPGAAILDHLNTITRRQLVMAKGIQDIRTAIADLRQKVAQEQQEVRARIDALEELIRNGGSQQEILDALAELQKAQDEVTAIYTAPDQDPGNGEEPPAEEPPAEEPPPAGGE